MEILQEAVKTCDFGWDVSLFTISTYHFMVRFEELPKKSINLLLCFEGADAEVP